jgi:hypothetical protein
MALPESVAEDDYVAAPRRILIGGEHTPQHRFLPERLEEALSHRTGHDGLGRAAARERQRTEAIQGHLLVEARVAFPVVEVGRRD